MRACKTPLNLDYTLHVQQKFVNFQGNFLSSTKGCFDLKLILFSRRCIADPRINDSDNDEVVSNGSLPECSNIYSLCNEVSTARFNYLKTSAKIQNYFLPSKLNAFQLKKKKNLLCTYRS